MSKQQELNGMEQAKLVHSRAAVRYAADLVVE